MAKTRPPRKPALIAVSLGLAGVLGAVGVYLVGSNQRGDDRAAYLEYEGALLVSLREGGMIVQQQMKPSLREARAGEIDGTNLGQRADGWRLAFNRLRGQVAALDPPALLGDVESRFLAAMDGYLSVADATAAAGAAGDPAVRDRLLGEAESAGERADDLFDRAAEIMQSHRRRLGLGTTPSLPTSAPG
jgi:hypothetical protein